MALEDILKAMETEARAEIARVKAQAEAAAAEIVARAEDEAKLVKARQLATLMPRLQKECLRLLNAAQLAALREMMEAREVLLGEAFAAVRRELARVREKSDYPRYLMRLLTEAMAELGNELCIVVNARDEALVHRLVVELGGRAQISTGLETFGGLEASTPDGRITVRNTLEARLDRSQRYLRRELASLLAAEMSWKPTITMETPASGR